MNGATFALKLGRISGDSQTSLDDRIACLELLHRIFSNISQNPGDDKFRAIACSSAVYRTHADRFPVISELLVDIGFRKCVIDFKEKWTLPRLGPIRLALLQDLLTDISDRLTQLQRKKEFQPLKEAKIDKKAYIAKILADAEEDRIAKLEREKRKCDILRRAQAARKSQKELAMGTLRRLGQ